jgi:hypothetical protein
MILDKFIAPFRPESGEEMFARIRAEIKAENEAKLRDPGLYVNSPHKRAGEIDDDSHAVIVP